MSARAEHVHRQRLQARTFEFAQMLALGIAIGYLALLAWVSTPALLGSGGSGYQVIKGSFRVDSHADFGSALERRVAPIHN